MRIIVCITSTHGKADGSSVTVHYCVSNDSGERVTSETSINTTLTEAQFNQAILDDARSVLEGAAGTVFEVGDEMLLVNACSLLKSTVSLKTGAAIISTPSLNDQLKTMLGGKK